MDYAQYPRPVLEDIVRLRRQMDRLNLPRKLVDGNVLVGTWNIRAFGPVYPKWDENSASPKRNLRAMAIITEIIRRFDVVAILLRDQAVPSIEHIPDAFNLAY